MCCVDRLSRLHKTDMAATFGDVRYREKSRLALTGSDRLAFARRANHFVFSEMACPAPFAKIFSFASDPNHFYIDHVLSQERGVAHVTSVGRDAVDAVRALDETGC